jgi:putative ABC transport system ATP-binding protein
MTEYIVESEDIVKIYQMGKVEVRALNGVSIKVKKGAFVSIMGHSGSGKSTLLHQLGLLDKPTSGRIVIDGVDVSHLSERKKGELRLKELGYVFQEYAILPELTAEENVYLPLMMLGVKGDMYRRKALDLLEQMGIGEQAGHLPQDLSGGEQQRVAIARALINNPKILFADEPTANLDSVTSKRLIELFGELNHVLGVTIVMVTHEEELGRMTDRIVHLKDGVVKEGL